MVVVVQSWEQGFGSYGNGWRGVPKKKRENKRALVIVCVWALETPRDHTHNTAHSCVLLVWSGLTPLSSAAWPLEVFFVTEATKCSTWEHTEWQKLVRGPCLEDMVPQHPHSHKVVVVVVRKRWVVVTPVCLCDVFWKLGFASSVKPLVCVCVCACTCCIKVEVVVGIK